MEQVLITGGTSGIGYELARCFLKENAQVIIVSSNIGRLQVTKKILEEEFGRMVKVYQQDLSQMNAALDLYEKVKKDGAVITTLVNNAGYGLVGGTNEIKLEQDRSMMIINMINLTELSKLFIEDMYKRGRGRILNVASTAAFQPGPYSSTYFASKSFVLSYSQAIAYEAKGKGVQVSALCPGATKTNFFVREGMATPNNALSAERVAKYCYKKFVKGKEVIIPGLYNNVQRIVPKKVKMRIIANMKKSK